jgi:hypothetical protein
MKTRANTKNKSDDMRIKDLKNPLRRANCKMSLSRKLKRGETEEPGDRGACEPESTTQGSE